MHFFTKKKFPSLTIYKNVKMCQKGQVFLIISGYYSACKSILLGILASCPTSCPTTKSLAVVRCVLERILKSYRSHQNCRIIGNKIVNYVSKSILQNHSVAFIQRTETTFVMDYV